MDNQNRGSGTRNRGSGTPRALIAVVVVLVLVLGGVLVWVLSQRGGADPPVIPGGSPSSAATEDATTGNGPGGAGEPATSTEPPGEPDGDPTDVVYIDPILDGLGDLTAFPMQAGVWTFHPDAPLPYYGHPDGRSITVGPVPGAIGFSAVRPPAWRSQSSTAVSALWRTTDPATTGSPADSSSAW